MATRVFISFRPEDSAWAARIRDGLQSLLGHNDLGRVVDFANALETRAREVDAVIVVVGRILLAGMLDDPNDRVRIEIEAALSLRIRVILVLVDGASMPAAGALPESLKALARLQPIELSAERFDSDMKRLEETQPEGAVNLSGGGLIEMPSILSHLRVSGAQGIAAPFEEKLARKPIGKKAAAKKPARKAAARIGATGGTAPKGGGRQGAAKPTARKSVAKKTARKGTAKKLSAKKTAAKKTAAKKPAAKKAARPKPEARSAAASHPRGTVNQNLSVQETSLRARAKRSLRAPTPSKRWLNAPSSALPPRRRARRSLSRSSCIWRTRPNARVSSQPPWIHRRN
jgi:TIR domain